MPIPAGNITTVNLDNTADVPAIARADLLALTQQFNVLIASANGVTGMATLDASGFLAGYGRLAAAQTWTGINTFAAANPLVLSSAAPSVQGRNTGLALPNGLWRLLLPSASDNFGLQKNTAAAGDFSTLVTPFFCNSTQATFAVPVAVGNAVAAGDAVNKGQLDAKVYAGRVNLAAGVATIVTAPPGWTAGRTAAGNVTITHNLGVTNYAVIPSMDSGNGWTIIYNSITANSFIIATFNSAFVLTDAAQVGFVVVRN